MTGISNQISLTHRSVIEEIFKFTVDTVAGYICFFFTVGKQPQKTMYVWNNWLPVNLLHWKTGGFLSLQIAFAQGHLWAHIQDLKCSAGFWTSKRSLQHIVLHISSLQGCSVFSWESCFHLEEHWARVSVRLTRLLAEACSPFCEACVSLWPWAFS